MSPQPVPNPDLKVLAFDTSTESLAVALQAPGGPWRVSAPGGAQASATLLPHIAGLLAQAGLAYADLDFIAFGRGPGAFTGLRTACAVAQGLGFGLGKPLLPIDSLLIVAEDARLQLAPLAAAVDVGVAMDARMDEVYAGLYRWGDGSWQPLRAPALLALPALAQAWADAPLQIIAGSALAAFGARLLLPAGGTRVVQEQDRAAALLRLALQAAHAGAGLDAAQALPLYLRDKVAQTTHERAHTQALRVDEVARAAAAGP